MKTITLILLGAAVLCAATQPSQTPAEKPKTLAQQRADAAAARARLVKNAAAKSASSQKAVQTTIPADAVEVGPNLYRRQDAQGKTWFYSNTPFGVSSWEDTPSTQAPAAPAAAKEDTTVTATDLGDRIQFESKSPFGSTKWTRKKSELTEEEKRFAAGAQPAAPQSPNKAAEKQ